MFEVTNLLISVWLLKNAFSFPFFKLDEQKTHYLNERYLDLKSSNGVFTKYTTRIYSERACGEEMPKTSP